MWGRLVTVVFILGIYNIVLGQEFYRVIPEDSIYYGAARILLENEMSNEIVLQYSYLTKDKRVERYKIAKYTTSGELKILKDFSEQYRWPSSLGNEMKIDHGLIYYADREWKKEEPNPDSLGWYYGVMDMEGQTLVEKKYNFRYKDWRVTFLYGLHLVGNGEVILWGAGTPPWNDPKINDPYVLWLRLKRDGTVVSGPHYRKPDINIAWAQPTDAALDADSNLVMVYDSKHADSRKFGIKILQNDSIEVAFELDYPVQLHPDDYSCIEITRNGDYIVTRPDPDYNPLPRLVRINKENQVVWEQSFERPSRPGIPFGPENTKHYYPQKILETHNGDVIICGLNNISDSFYVAGTHDKVISAGRSGSFLARFSKEGELLWVHHMAYVVEDGSLRNIRMFEVIELQDGRLCVGGNVGIPGTKNDVQPFVMFLDANGCKDETCSNVDKWWYFPDLIPGPPEDTLVVLPELTVYPNPASDVLYIHIPYQDEYSGSLICIMSDSRGQTVYQKDISFGMHEVDISHFPPGVYYVMIHTSYGSKWSVPWVKW
jgi:hypothetical protein